MDFVLQDMLFRCVYIDDVPLFLKSIKKPFDLLYNAIGKDIRPSFQEFKFSKCYFPYGEIKLLCHVVRVTGALLGDKQISAIKDTTISKSETEQRSFQRLSGYCQRFLSELSELPSSLNAATTSFEIPAWTFKMKFNSKVMSEKPTTPPLVLIFRFRENAYCRDGCSESCKLFDVRPEQRKCR